MGLTRRTLLYTKYLHLVLFMTGFRSLRIHDPFRPLISFSAWVRHYGDCDHGAASHCHPFCRTRSKTLAALLNKECILRTLSTAVSYNSNPFQHCHGWLLYSMYSGTMNTYSRFEFLLLQWNNFLFQMIINFVGQLQKMSACFIFIFLHNTLGK